MNSPVLPDITTDSSSTSNKTLQWVGMENIALPMMIEQHEEQTIQLLTKIDVYVSLSNAEAKGIHMSRLHRLLNQLQGKQINKDNLDSLLVKLIESQNGISDGSKINVSFDLILRKPSLVSGESGFQSYPISIHGERINNKSSFRITFNIPYSSTCPCSESLARHHNSDVIRSQFPVDNINRDRFLNWYESKETVLATPHSQRSFAYFELTFEQNAWPDITTLIFQLEGEVGTPVQTIVKRNDEQEFAKINAENLMFCEDSARKIKSCLDQMPFLSGYSLKVEHQESLHAHNAVVIDKKDNVYN